MPPEENVLRDVGVPPIDTCMSIPSMTRKRILELTDLALKVARYMDEMGIKRNEYCTFGEIIRRMIEYKEE